MSSISSTSSSTTSSSSVDPNVINRISGLASGMDIDKMVSQLMTAARMPEDTLKQNLQIIEWQQDAYRTVNTDLNNLQNTVFNLKLQGSFLGKKVTSSDDSIVTASAGVNATATTYQVKVSQLATAATNASMSKISGTILGNTLSVPVTIAPNADFKLALNGGAAVDITLTAHTYDGSGPGNNLSDLAADIQTQVNNAVGSGKVNVSLTSDNRINFTPVVQGDNTVPAIVISSGTTNDVLATLGLVVPSGQSSITPTAIDPNASLWSQKDRFLSGNFGWTNHNFSFTINGQSFSVNGDTDSLNSVIAAVNSNASAGVSMFYDPSTDKLGISTLKTGANQPGKQIQVTGGFLTDVLHINQANEQGGTDALFQINGLSGMTSHSNTTTINGVTFNLKGATAGGFTGVATTVTVAADIDTMVSTIKDFITQYNNTLADLNGKLTEQAYPDYKPLTDAQLSTGKLTSTQIDQWTAKAKSGLLNNDSLLSSAVYAMRNAIESPVSGLNDQVTVTVGSQQVTTAASQMSVIGITTGSYTENGKLYLDENRLREALQSNPQAVMDLFTKSTDSSGNQITDSSQQGLAVRLYNTLGNSISQVTNQAGSSSDLVDSSYMGQSMKDLNTQISDMDTQLQAMETRYYNEFSTMEQAISQLNSQGAWLSQMLGTSSGK